MDTYAQLDANGVCANVITLEPADEAAFAQLIGSTLILISAAAGGPGIGWTYTAGVWTAPA